MAKAIQTAQHPDQNQGFSSSQIEPGFSARDPIDKRMGESSTAAVEGSKKGVSPWIETRWPFRSFGQ